MVAVLFVPIRKSFEVLQCRLTWRGDIDTELC